MTFNLEESKSKERFSNRNNSYKIFKLFFNKFVLPVTLYRLKMICYIRIYKNILIVNLISNLL